MKLRLAVNYAAKRVPFVRTVALGAYKLYWRGRTTRDMARFYADAPMRLMGNAGYAEPNLTQLTSQLCTASQCLEPRYRHWCDEMKSPPRLGRKQWEFVFILEALSQQGMLEPGKRGLGFGCGREPLAAVMAKHGCEIVATDLAAEEAAQKGWVETDQHTTSLSALNHSRICEPQFFARNVSFRFADMNAIAPDLTGFDFVWSSCAFEHLGSIRMGLDFVKNAMRCLKPGGVAIHTTEYNLSSDDETFEDPNCVLFRKRDMLLLAQELEREGHRVATLNFHSGSMPVDKHVDFPPFSASPHLKLKLAEFVTTSIGLIVTKGPQ